ncbi:MAG: prepilin-type N-terminal cleavage/methylation domain-containing protein, partial [Methylophagaceae bacterium]
MKMTNKNRGFSLIEVMVALLVLALGILGISKLQGTLIKNSSDANQRSVAMTLAQKKVDDLKSFVHLDADLDNDPSTPDATWDPTDPLDEQSYAFIADNAGGTITSGNMTVGNYAYALSWEASPYFYASSGVNPTSTAGASIVSQFKQVEVTVAWNDETGTAQSVVLETVVDAYAPDLTALSDNSHDGGDLPRARYTPELAPDVIDIEVDTGGGIKRQTSKPLPDAVSQGSNSNILVSFEVISYHQDGSEFIRDRQEEFVTVDCHCNLSAADATAFPPGHILWNETDNDRHDFVDLPISKASGSETNNVNAVEEICDTCCRDHHDDSASPVKYVEGTAIGDHPHYRASGALATTPGHEYIESCRFKRIDGVLRVFQDWDLKD